MPLEEIGALLSASEGEAASLLEAHEQRLFNRFQSQRESLRAISEMLRGKRHLPQLEVREREWKTQTILSVRDSATGEDFQRVWQAAYEEIHAVLEGAGVSAAGLEFELYHNKEFLGEALETEFCVPINEAIPVSGRVRVGVHGVHRVACAVHTGTWRTYGSSYAAVQTWLEAQGRRVSGSAYTLRLPDGGVELGFPVE
jgi:effector-binding domain-containing protein